MLLAFFATKVHYWLIFSLPSARLPKYSAALPPVSQFPAHTGTLFPRCRSLHLPYWISQGSRQPICLVYQGPCKWKSCPIYWPSQYGIIGKLKPKCILLPFSGHWKRHYMVETPVALHWYPGRVWTSNCYTLSLNIQPGFYLLLVHPDSKVTIWTWEYCGKLYRTFC